MSIERLDSPAGGHLYRLADVTDALAVPGATTIIDEQLPEPEQLTAWRRRQDVCAGITKVLRIAQIGDDVLQRLIDDPPDQWDDLVIAALADADTARQATMDAGSRDHDTVAQWLMDRQEGRWAIAPEDGSTWWKAAAAVVNELDLEAWQTEVTGIRLPHYGGTIDLIGWDTAGVCHIVDWKTTDSDHLTPVRYREALQIAAYSGLQTAAVSTSQVPVGRLVPFERVRGHVARINQAGEACLCEVDIDALWPKWVRLLEDYQPGQMGRGWFTKSVRRLP